MGKRFGMRFTESNINKIPQYLQSTYSNIIFSRVLPKPPIDHFANVSVYSFGIWGALRRFSEYGLCVVTLGTFGLGFYSFRPLPD